MQCLPIFCGNHEGHDEPLLQETQRHESTGTSWQMQGATGFQGGSNHNAEGNAVGILGDRPIRGRNDRDVGIPVTPEFLPHKLFTLRTRFYTHKRDRKKPWSKYLIYIDIIYNSYRYEKYLKQWSNIDRVQKYFLVASQLEAEISPAWNFSGTQIFFAIGAEFCN